jgi:hypothetical protein
VYDNCFFYDVFSLTSPISMYWSDGMNKKLNKITVLIMNL